MMKIKILLILLLLLSSCHKEEKIADDISDNNRIFYEIFVGSYSDSDGDGIGDLRGIINRFNHLNDGNRNSNSALGIQGIWLSPIFKAGSYHKYDVIDYYSIDPDFGNEEDLLDLIEMCHERNVLVILDLAINHTSLSHDWFVSFKEAHKNNDFNNPYYNYYIYETKDYKENGKTFCKLDDDEVYECNFSLEMPELNFDNEAVRNEVLQIGEYYLSKGVDGFRFDAARYLYLNDDTKNIDFWSWYANELKKIKPDIYLVSEVWGQENQSDAYFKATNCFNFSLAGAEGLIASTTKGDNINIFTDYIVKYINKIHQINPESMLIPFISNHDMDRSAGYLNINNHEAQFAANLYLLLPGSPFIYYGEEIGMKGSRGNANTDANRRLAMLWGDGDTVKDPIGSDYKKENQNNGTVTEHIANHESLLKHYNQLIKIRNSYPAIRNGEYEILDLHNENVGGFRIKYNNEEIFIIHNNSRTPVTISSLGFKEILESIGDEDSTYSDNKLTIAPMSSVIMR